MFEWKSGEDEEWVEEQPTAVAAHPSARLSGKIKGVVALMVAGLLVLVGLGLVYRQVNTLVTAVTNTLGQEVIAADRLLVETAIAGDNELLVTLLSRSGIWIHRQIQLQTHGGFFDRPPLNLWLDTRTDLFNREWNSSTQFIFTPDLNSVELKMMMPYITLDEAGEMQSLLLQRTAVYERQGNGWLLAEPGHEFWGEYVHEERPYLDLITPTRDQEIASRLADDLNNWTDRICQDIDCPETMMLQLRLDNDPKSLLELHSLLRFTTDNANGQPTNQLLLPAPTLVGLPLDEAGYQTLLRGYAAHLAQALLNAYTFPPPANTRSVFTNPNVSQMLDDWGLFAPPSLSYNPISAAEAPSIPLPEQDILMLCSSNRTLNLFRYDMATDTWFDLPLTTEGTLDLRMFPFPHGQGVILVVSPSTGDAPFQVIWLHDGRERLLFSTIARPTINLVSELEPGRFLLRYFTEKFTDENSSTIMSFDTITVIEITATACDDSTCPVQPFIEWVQPSPDGRYTLVTRLDENQDFVYALGDAAGEEIKPLENAHNPIWLDGRTLFYLEKIPSGTSQYAPDIKVMATTIINDESVQMEQRVSMKEIYAALPPLPPNHQLYIGYVTPYLAGQFTQLFISVYDSNPRTTINGFLLRYDWLTDNLIFLPETLSAPLNSHLTPLWPSSQHNGYLALHNHADSGVTLGLYDIPNQRWQVFESVNPRLPLARHLSWSDSGDWFIVLDSGMARLIAPEYGYQKLLFHGLDYCVAALFVDRAGRNETGP